MIKVTIDTSVFVAGFLEGESKSKDAGEILEKIYNLEYFVNIPSTILVEITSALNRRTRDPKLADTVKNFLKSLPNINFVTLNLNRATKASDVAMETGLRGMDAIVVSIAKEFESELITFDKEMETRAKVVLG